MPFSRDPLQDQPSQLSKAVIRPSESVGNPFLTIWFRPRATIREILDTGNHDPEVAMAWLFGIAIMINPLVFVIMPSDFTPVVYVIRFGLIGSSVGAFLLLTAPWLLHNIGRMLGGEGEDFEARCVYGWSLVPCITTFFLGLPLVFMFGESYFSKPTHWINDVPFIYNLVGYYRYLDHLTSLWMLCIIVAGQRETHRFGWWRALLSLLITLLILAGPLWLILKACLIILGAR